VSLERPFRQTGYGVQDGNWHTLGGAVTQEAAKFFAGSAECHDALEELEIAASLVALQDNSDQNPEARRLRAALTRAKAALAAMKS